MKDDRGDAQGMTGLTLHDLLHLHLEARRHRDGDSDTWEDYEQPALAAASAFGVYLDKPPVDDDGLGDLLRCTLAQLEHLRSPFAGFLEGPMPVRQLHRRYAGRINEARSSLHDALVALAVDVIARLWRIDADTTVSWDEPAAHAFQRPPKTPDPFDV